MVQTFVKSIAIVCFIWTSQVFATESVQHDFIKASHSDNKIEFFWSKPDVQGKRPLLVLLHPHQEWPNKIGGEIFVKNKSIETWTKNGFITVAVSMPNYGKSEGDADFCGAKTQDAVEDVITHFKSMEITDTNKIFLYGGSRGAVVAALGNVKNFVSGVFNV